MVRIVSIALVSLAAVGLVAIYRLGFAALAIGPVTSAVPLVTADLPDTASAKSNKLDVHPLPDLLTKTVVHTIAIAVPADIVQVKKAPPEKAKTIISRHWRTSYARMAPRAVRQPQQSELAAKPQDTRSRLLNWLKIGG
jgi:hypothetical protein